MRSLFSILIPLALVIMLVSCGGKNKKSTDTNSTTKDTTTAVQPAAANIDTTLNSARPALANELKKWAQSFTNFNVDSFHYQRESSDNYKNDDMGAPDDMKHFYTFYKASLIYSPDSSQFIDLYSANVGLEKRGKKIIAIGDADQTVMLCDVKNNIWRAVAFFGPSGGIEEAVWTSPSTFILAGSMSNENSEWQPFLILGNTTDRSKRFFESRIVRPQSSKYEASGWKTLKIDSWD